MVKRVIFRIIIIIIIIIIITKIEMFNIKVKIDKKELETINEKNIKIAIENWENILVLYM